MFVDRSRVFFYISFQIAFFHIIYRSKLMRRNSCNNTGLYLDILQYIGSWRNSTLTAYTCLLLRIISNCFAKVLFFKYIYLIFVIFYMENAFHLNGMYYGVLLENRTFVFLIEKSFYILWFTNAANNNCHSQHILLWSFLIINLSVFGKIF